MTHLSHHGSFQSKLAGQRAPVTGWLRLRVVLTLHRSGGFNGLSLGVIHSWLTPVPTSLFHREGVREFDCAVEDAVDAPPSVGSRVLEGSPGPRMTFLPTRFKGALVTCDM